MKLNNASQLKSEDYDDEYQGLIDQLSEVINPFMQEVVELSDERIDFENRVEEIKTIEFTVDSSGKPILNDKLNTGKTGIRGFSVIRAFNLTNSSNYPTSHPFINYTPLGGALVRIDNITGLVANNKYQLTIIIY